jgi:hypothetical protein
MCGFFTTDELDDLLFEASEVSRFLLEVEGTTLDIDEEIDVEDRITKVMRSVGEAAKTILKARNEDESMPDKPQDTLPDTPTEHNDFQVIDNTITSLGSEPKDDAPVNDNTQLTQTIPAPEEPAEPDPRDFPVTKDHPW